MQLKQFLIIATVFLAGAFAGNGYATTHAAFSSPVYNDGYELPTQVYSGITGSAIPRASPGDHVKERQIAVYDDKVVLDLQHVIFAKFTPTNSMDPILDETANALEIVPRSEAQVNEGDIVAYQNSCTGDGTIIHRVITKGSDQLGTYYLVRGDNNGAADPCKVRFEDVKSVVVGIIY